MNHLVVRLSYVKTKKINKSGIISNHRFNWQNREPRLYLKIKNKIVSILISEEEEYKYILHLKNKNKNNSLHFKSLASY